MCKTESLTSPPKPNPLEVSTISVEGSTLHPVARGKIQGMPVRIEKLQDLLYYHKNTRKLDTIQEVTIFRRWTTGSVGQWSLRRETTSRALHSCRDFRLSPGRPAQPPGCPGAGGFVPHPGWGLGIGLGGSPLSQRPPWSSGVMAEPASPDVVSWLGKAPQVWPPTWQYFWRCLRGKHRARDTYGDFTAPNLNLEFRCTRPTSLKMEAVRK